MCFLRKAKEVSVERSSSLGELVEESLRVTTLAARDKGGRKSRRPLKTFRGDGVQPGVDLKFTAALLELMDSR